MTARIGGTLAMALLAAGWTAAALPARAQAMAGQRPTMRRAQPEPGKVGLLARARDWIERAARGAHQPRR